MRLFVYMHILCKQTTPLVFINIFMIWVIIINMQVNPKRIMMGLTASLLFALGCHYTGQNRYKLKGIFGNL